MAAVIAVVQLEDTAYVIRFHRSVFESQASETV